MTKHKRLLVILLIVIALLVLALAGIAILLNRKPGSVPVVPVAAEKLPAGKQPAEPREPEGEIVLISRYVNYAWDFDDEGLFVDSAGYVYAFDFSDLGSSSDIIGKLELLRRWENPSAHVDPSEMEAFVRNARRISDYGTFHKEEKMCDYGEKQLIFRDPNTGEQHLLGEWGDIDRTLTDWNASAAIRKGQAIIATINAACSDDLTIRLYTPEDVPFLELPADGKSGRYLLRYVSQLPLLSAETGLPLDTIADDLNEYALDKYACFIDLAATGNPTALLCRDGYISILTAGEGEPHCIVALFPKSTYPLTDTCHDLAGAPWTLYQNGDPEFDPDIHKGLSYGVSDERMHLVWEEFGMHGYKGVCLQTQEDYERFLRSCEAHDLMEDKNAVQELLEEDLAPDFANYVLCVRIARREVGMKFGWEPLIIADGCVHLGLVSDPPQDKDHSGPRTDGVIACVWLPRHYLMTDRSYSVW